jgi:hypothetical protein
VSAAIEQGVYVTNIDRSSDLRIHSLRAPSCRTPISLAGPGWSGGAHPSRRCRGCSHPPLRLQARAAPSFNGLLRQARGGVLSSPPGTWRPVAHQTHTNTRRNPCTSTQQNSCEPGLLNTWRRSISRPPRCGWVPPGLTLGSVGGSAAPAPSRRGLDPHLGEPTQPTDTNHSQYQQQRKPK